MPYRDKADRRARYKQRKLEDPEWDERQKEASRERSRQWYQENRERRLKAGRTWDKAFPEKRREYTAKYRERNPDVSYEWYLRNREEKLAANKRWRKENPEKWRAISSAKAARRRGAEIAGERVIALVVLERDDGICGICGRDVDPLNFHIDHIIPVSLGGEHSYANVQVAHPVCNVRKHQKIDFRIAA